VAFLRFLIILLILVNLLVLAAWQGWLGQGGRRGEPERLTNQLRPEAITLIEGPLPEPAPPAPEVPEPAAAPVEPSVAEPEPAPEVAPATAEPTPPAAPVAEAPVPAAPPACVAFAELDDEQAALVMGDALARPGLAAKDIPSTEITSWWVHIPSQGSRDAAERKVTELRAKGVKDLFASGEKSARPFTVSLGLFKSAESAAEQRRRLEARGVTGIAIEERGQTSHRIEVRGAAELVTVWASDWKGRLPEASRLDCRP
jgi:hypothetical protein